MDEQSRIQTYKESLRLIYADDLVGLRKKISDLHTESEDSVIVTNSAFEGEQTSGQLVLEPLAKLNAAIALLKELDPDNVPESESVITHADFSGGSLEV